MTSWIHSTHARPADSSTFKQNYEGEGWEVTKDTATCSKQQIQHSKLWQLVCWLCVLGLWDNVPWEIHIPPPKNLIWKLTRTTQKYIHVKNAITEVSKAAPFGTCYIYPNITIILYQVYPPYHLDVSPHLPHTSTELQPREPYVLYMPTTKHHQNLERPAKMCGMGWLLLCQFILNSYQVLMVVPSTSDRLHLPRVPHPPTNM